VGSNPPSFPIKVNGTSDPPGCPKGDPERPRVGRIEQPKPIDTCGHVQIGIAHAIDGQIVADQPSSQIQGSRGVQIARSTILQDQRDLRLAGNQIERRAQHPLGIVFDEDGSEQT
jgi:hypothetical protein